MTFFCAATPFARFEAVGVGAGTVICACAWAFAVAPAVAIVAIFTTIAVWNDFFFPLILIFDNDLKTVPLAITNFVGQFRTDWGMVFASLAISLAPVTAMYLVLARQIRDGERVETLTGTVSSARRTWTTTYRKQG